MTDNERRADIVLREARMVEFRSHKEKRWEMCWRLYHEPLEDKWGIEKTIWKSREPL